MTDTVVVGSINIAPQSSVYSPHVRVLKDFIENLTQLSHDVQDQRADPGTLADGFGPIETSMELAAYVEGELDRVREAMSDVLTDDFMLIVDGKRFTGNARQDVRK